MKTVADKGKASEQRLDLRVRARHLASGALDPKAVERYLAELPDLEASAESLPFDQPALSGRSGGAGSEGEP
ncbi:MAG: hypothetical protein U0359_04395 [Byssovorax sp.]